jgi:hypothetical protein
MVKRCHQTETFPITFEDIWSAIRSGNTASGKITLIRNRYEAERDITGSVERPESCGRPENGAYAFWLQGHSQSARMARWWITGLLCADLDSLGTRLPQIREMLKSVPYVRAIALSPSGDGLKVFFNVVNDPLRHEDSFRAIRDNVRDLGVEIDEKCKDLARICFFTYDPDVWIRLEGNATHPPAEPLPRGRTTAVPALTSADVNMTVREQIGFRLLGELRAAGQGRLLC